MFDTIEITVNLANKSIKASVYWDSVKIRTPPIWQTSRNPRECNAREYISNPDVLFHR